MSYCNHLNTSSYHARGHKTSVCLCENSEIYCDTCLKNVYQSIKFGRPDSSVWFHYDYLTVNENKPCTVQQALLSFSGRRKKLSYSTSDRRIGLIFLTHFHEQKISCSNQPSVLEQHTITCFYAAAG